MTVTNQMIAVIMISCHINVIPRESHPGNVWEDLACVLCTDVMMMSFLLKAGLYMYMYVKWTSGHSKTVFQFGSNLMLSLPSLVPRPSPSFPSLPYCKRRKAGWGLGTRLELTWCPGTI